MTRRTSAQHRQPVPAPARLTRRIWRGLALAAAATAWAVPAAIVALAIWVLIGFWPAWQGLLIAAVLLGAAAVVVPRPPAVPDSEDGAFTIAERAAFAAFCRQVAAACATPGPTIAVFDAGTTASCLRVGWRRVRVLRIGACLWVGCEPAERTALLAGALADGAGPAAPMKPSTRP